MLYLCVVNKIMNSFVAFFDHWLAEMSEMRIHCNSVITRSSGSTGKKRVITYRVITDRVLYTRPLFKPLSHT